jgi:hypothetical protein
MEQNHRVHKQARKRKYLYLQTSEHFLFPIFTLQIRPLSIALEMASSINTAPDSASSVPTDIAPDMVSSFLTDTAPNVVLSPLTDLEHLSRRVRSTMMERWGQPTVEEAPDEDEESAWQIFRHPTMQGMDSSPPSDTENLSVQPTRADKWNQRAVILDENGGDTPQISPRSAAADVVSPPLSDIFDLSERMKRTRVDKGKQRAVAPNDEQDVPRADPQRIDSLNVLRRTPPRKPKYKEYYAAHSAQMRKQKLDELSVKFGCKRAKSSVCSCVLQLGDGKRLMVTQDEVDVEKDHDSVLLPNKSVACQQQASVSVDGYYADHGESSGSGSSNTRIRSSSPLYEEHQERFEAISMHSDHSDTRGPSFRRKDEVRARSKSRDPSTSRSSSKSSRRHSLSPLMSSDSPASTPSIVEYFPSDQPSFRTWDGNLSNTITTSSQPPLALSPFDRFYSSRIPSPHLSYSASLRRTSALSPRQSNPILHMKPVPSIHSKFSNVLMKTLCCRPGSVTPTQRSRLPVRVSSTIPIYIKKRVRRLRKPNTVRFEMVQTELASAASSSSLSTRRDAMSLSSDSALSQTQLVGAVSLSDMILRAPESVVSGQSDGDGGLGEKLKHLSLEDLPLREGEREEISRLLRDMERDSKEFKDHPYRLTKEEDVSSLHTIPYSFMAPGVEC